LTSDVMPAKTNASSQKTRLRKTVGAVAIILMLVFTVLTFEGIFSWLDWLIADLIVFAVANLLFRKLKEPI
jgi:hypothetical protein